MVTPSYCSYTVLGKFTTKLRLRATSAIQSYVNVRQNGDSKRPPGWRGPQEEPKTITKKAPREPLWAIFRAWLGGTPGRDQNTHEKSSQGAILSHFQSLAGRDPRKRLKQSRKRSPEAIVRHFQGLAQGDPRQRQKQLRKRFPGSHSVTKTATPSYRTHTTLCKFTTKLRPQAIKPIKPYVNLRQNCDSKLPNP